MRASYAAARASKPRSWRRGGRLGMDLRSGSQRQADLLGATRPAKVIRDVDAQLRGCVLDLFDIDAIDHDARLPSLEVVGDPIDDVASKLQRVGAMDQRVE